MNTNKMSRKEELQTFDLNDLMSNTEKLLQCYTETTNHYINIMGYYIEIVSCLNQEKPPSPKDIELLTKYKKDLHHLINALFIVKDKKDLQVTPIISHFLSTLIKERIFQNPFQKFSNLKEYVEIISTRQAQGFSCIVDIEQSTHMRVLYDNLSIECYMKIVATALKDFPLPENPLDECYVFGKNGEAIEGIDAFPDRVTFCHTYYPTLYILNKVKGLLKVKKHDDDGNFNALIEGFKSKIEEKRLEPWLKATLLYQINKIDPSRVDDLLESFTLWLEEIEPYKQGIAKRSEDDYQKKLYDIFDKIQRIKSRYITRRRNRRKKSEMIIKSHRSV